MNHFLNESNLLYKFCKQETILCRKLTHLKLSNVSFVKVHTLVVSDEEEESDNEDEADDEDEESEEEYEECEEPTSEEEAPVPKKETPPSPPQITKPKPQAQKQSGSKTKHVDLLAQVNICENTIKTNCFSSENSAVSFQLQAFARES